MARRASSASNSSVKDTLEPTSPGGSGSERQLSDVSEKGDFRRLQNDMQIVTFKVRALEEKIDKISKDAGISPWNGPGGRGVAFTARLSNNQTVYSQQTIVFDDALTNIGRAYNPVTGIFIAPYTGRYMFSLSVRAQYQKQVCAEIVAEPEVVGQLAAGDTEIERASASLTVVTSLEKGNEVYVRETKTWTGHFFGEGFTVFTGYLLQ